MLAAGIVAAVVTAPKPNYEKMLGQAEGMIAHDEYRPALDLLNKKLRLYYDHGSLTPEQGRRFHLARARAVYLGEKQAGVENEENAKSVVEEFGAAQKDGAKLEPRDQVFLAEANVTLGRFDEAQELLAALPASEREARGHIVKKMVMKRLEAPGASSEDLLRMLAEFLKDPELSATDRAWALGRQSELLLRSGLPERAIAKLVQTMPALVNACTPEQMGELYLLLGRAYWEAQSLTDAGRQLEQAVAALPETDERRGEAMVLLGRVDELTKASDEGRQEARSRYMAVVDKFGETRVALPALLGLGEVEAAGNDFEASIRAYTRLVHEMKAGKSHPDALPAVVTGSLMDRYRGRFDTGDTQTALKYATLAEQLYSADSVPPEVLLAVAKAHRKAAMDLLKSVGNTDRVNDLARVDPATREQARLELLSAGQYFKRHADRVGVADNAAYGESLWTAADSFDLAGDPEQAIPLFTDYAKYFPGDPRQAEARYRLGQAYQARGDYGTAAQLYKGLRDDAASPGNNIGPFADLSVVPLAETMLMDTDPANDAEAATLLQDVVEGRVGDPKSNQFRDGLVELARLKRRNHDYAGAITHLEEAVARFPDDPRLDDLRYDLADSYRQDAHAIEKTLDEGMPDHKKIALQEARVDRLRKARDLFEVVRRSLEAKDQRRLGKLELLQLRNSYFYMGDCDFDLKDFEGAIRHYDAARERYPRDPASLVAMMQIVNAYVELGDTQRAQTAQNRAMQFYDTLPASVWNDPDLPMGREDWQHWLDSMNKLKSMNGTQAQGQEGNP